MAAKNDAVEKFTVGSPDVWWQRGEQKIFLGDVLDGSNDVKMSVGYARYDGAESNPWTVTYDEALIVTKGRFIVDGENGPVSAGPGEVIYLRAGAKVVYRTEEPTELVYVTYPHWYEATSGSPEAARLAEFHRAD
ncbi:cupin [Spongiactinospora gelatinilytica]|uniref:Cupin n=1 Tax=Spongiactinospora gelatinilytica TaxID=2666298 RepID=A0A2W2HF37_9ACTN|nr:cupin [Spongiactinospora gelatinilytica]PZG50395.1 cupin [Spongiactinospora gelatinilytica]